MAEVTFSGWLQDMANAIREKTGEPPTVKKKPINYPTEIREKLSAIGGGSFDGEGTVRVDAGTFTASGRKTITHNLGAKPDLVWVYYNDLALSLDNEAQKMYLMGIWGLSSNFNSTVRGAYVAHGWCQTTADGIDQNETAHANMGTIYCPDDKTLVVGKAANSAGKQGFVPNATYRWIAFSGIGGSYSPDICYVTLMNHDGTVELGRKPVAMGDDCPDTAELIERGFLTGTPTKEPTVQNVYPHVGWATTPNGAVDSNALKDVTADRVVYSAHNVETRTYTIRFMDGDKVLESKGWPYGSTPSIAPPEKSGYNFERWEPAISTVTSDMDYYAQWTENVTFAGSSWADIAEVSESGRAADFFKVGDSRNIPVTINGTQHQFVAKIVGMNHDDLADGSGKAGLSIMFFTTPSEKCISYEAFSTIDFISGYGESVIRDKIEEYYTRMPTELKSVIKKVSKSYNYFGKTSGFTQGFYLWAPSVEEVGRSSATPNAKLGTKYEHFKTYGYADSGNTNWFVYDTDGTKQTSFWVRDMNPNSGKNEALSLRSGGSVDSSSSTTITKNLAIGFCI